jgi:hypothetical protein
MPLVTIGTPFEPNQKWKAEEKIVMAKDIQVSWGYREGSDHDDSFYRSLPGAKESWRTSDGRPPLGGDFGQVLIFVGGAALSSTTLAAAIKAYIEGRKRKIVISIDGSQKRIEYEGPDLAADIKTIEAMIDKLVEESNSNTLTLHATSHESFKEQLKQSIITSDEESGD